MLGFNAVHSMIISTHAPRTGSDDELDMERCDTEEQISTHAPRTGSDGNLSAPATGPADFNPRSPHGERHCTAPGLPRAGTFQPTLPARGATPRKAENGHGKDFNPRSPHGERHSKSRDGGMRRYFNPRSPHGERPTDGDAQAPPRKISTHAPRTGSDPQGFKSRRA